MARMSFKSVIFAALAATTLSACAIPDGMRAGLRGLAEKDGIIIFDHAPFDQGATDRVVYANASERDEYALFKAGDAQAEFVYVTTRTRHQTNLMIDDPISADEAINAFHHNRGEVPQMGDAVLLDNHGIRSWAKPYLLPKAGKTCGAVSGKWDQLIDAPLPTRVMFGYFCEAGTDLMTAQELDKMVDKIGLRGITVNALPGSVYVPTRTEEPMQVELLARAKGSSESKQGNVKFPYEIVRQFKRSDECIYDPSC